MIDWHLLRVHLAELAAEIGLSGVVDILLMAVMIYAGLVWLRRSQASKVAQGISITGLLYLVSRQFNLYLTSVVLEAFFAVALVAIIVIFRNELRRFFERVARWRLAGSLGRRKIVSPISETKDILTRTLSDLARDHIGALVVLTGKESIDIHLEGGVQLNGELSEALLKSLFDAHSIGHDGAVVIEGGQVSRFACHLPLSTSFDKLGNRGTRHAAALGLAERSDALCIVVSEERGTVSVAEDGALRELTGPEQLAGLLTAHGQDAPATVQPLRVLIQKNYRSKIAALGISLLLWLVLVHGAKHTVRSLNVPVDLTDVPAGMKVKVEPRAVKVTLVGPRRSFFFLGRDSVQVTLSLADLKSEVSYKAIHVSDVMFPKDLTLRSFRPSRVRVSVPGARGDASGPASER